MFDNFNVNLRQKGRICNLYSMYSFSGIRSIERTLRQGKSKPVASTEAGSYIWSDLATDENIQARYAVEVKNRFQALKNEVLDQSALDYDTFVQSSAEAAERCLRKIPRQRRK